MYGPDVTFLGVARCDLDDPTTYADADVVILGAPFDGGTSHRPGSRFGPQAIRTADYLPHDGSRSSLALRTDGLVDLRVYDAGDVEMFAGDIERSLGALERSWSRSPGRGDPGVAGRRPLDRLPDAKAAPLLGAGRVSISASTRTPNTGDISFGSLPGHAQPMRRLIDSGALRGDQFLQIGLRGYWPPPDRWTGWPGSGCGPTG